MRNGHELKKWEEWLINHVLDPARWEVREEFRDIPE